MLQITPESDLKTTEDPKTDDALYCRACGHLITRRRWLLDRGGGEHVLTNPVGIVFTVICFADAPGAGRYGEPTLENTWFDGYEWCFALCRACQTHLGWVYENANGPDGFYGLIKDNLSSGPASS
jgi:hypothetical protein